MTGRTISPLRSRGEPTEVPELTDGGHFMIIKSSYTMTEASRHMSRIVNDARSGHEPIMITDRGQPVAAVISPAALARFQALENDADLAVIEEIKARGEHWIPAAEAIPMMEQMLADAEDDEARHER